MASTAAPYGARPVGTLSASGSFTSKTRLLEIASGFGTAIFNGDFVKLVADGTVEKDTGTTALTTCGIFLGCQYTDPGSGQLTFSTQWPAGTVAADAKAFVLDDPHVLMQMQADGSLALTTRGLNAAVVQTAGSTAIGKSKVTVNAGSAAATNTLPLRIIDFVDGPDSAVGDSFTDVIVKFNAASSGSASTHQYLNATGA
jgi:hypothetical protein